MDRAAKQALLPDYDFFSVDLTEGKSANCSIQVSATKCSTEVIFDLFSVVFTELRGSNKLVFYFIDLFDSVIRSVQGSHLERKSVP